MTWKGLLGSIDAEELTMQMAYDAVEADEQQARRRGVKSTSEVLTTPAAGRLRRGDPDWFRKLARLHKLD